MKRKREGGKGETAFVVPLRDRRRSRRRRRWEGKRKKEG